MSEPEIGHPMWLHVNKRCPKSCSYCDIAKLQAELAELREAGNKIISAIRSGLSQDELEAMDEFELLQGEKNG